jgi:chromosome segregation ATPase
MKLNKFFEKNRARKTVKKVISFTNEKRDKEFQIQIDDLTSQLSRYKDIEKNNDRLNNAKHEYEKDRKGLVGEINDLKQENKTFELEIETLTPKATAMEDTIKSSNQYQEQLKQLQHDIESYKRSRIQQDKNINLLSKERSEFQIDLKDVEKKYNQEKKTHLDVANLYQQLKKEYNNLLGFSQENSKISIEQKNKINDLTVKLDFLEADAAGARVKMEQAEKIKDQLQTWIDSLEHKSNEEKAKIGYTDTKLSQAEQTIEEMASTIDDLMSEMQYVVSLNQKYKTELEKPRYMSMESIARKEGFKIPGIAAAKNYNKLHLGNAKPTLLKFK